MAAAAETVRAVPMMGAIATRIPWASSSVRPLPAAAPALSVYEMGGASTAARAAMRASMMSRSARSHRSRDAAVMARRVPATGVSGAEVYDMADPFKWGRMSWLRFAVLD